MDTLNCQQGVIWVLLRDSHTSALIAGVTRLCGPPGHDVSFTQSCFSRSWDEVFISSLLYFHFLLLDWLEPSDGKAPLDDFSSFCFRFQSLPLSRLWNTHYASAFGIQSLIDWYLSALRGRDLRVLVVVLVDSSTSFYMASVLGFVEQFSVVFLPVKPCLPHAAFPDTSFMSTTFNFLELYLQITERCSFLLHQFLFSISLPMAPPVLLSSSGYPLSSHPSPTLSSPNYLNPCTLSFPSRLYSSSITIYIPTSDWVSERYTLARLIHNISPFYYFISLDSMHYGKRSRQSGFS